MKLKLLFLLLVIFQISYSQTAKMQFIHNAPDVSIAEVDVYVDDNLIIDNLAFKTGSTFLDIPFNGDMAQITITRSTDENEILVSRERILVDQENYYVVIDGIFDTASYTDTEPFDIYLYEGAHIEADFLGEEYENTDIQVHHGSIGFNFPLTVYASGALACGGLLLSDNLNYSGFGDNYIHGGGTEDYYIDIFGGDFSYGVMIPFQTQDLMLEDQGLLMLLTGFRNPEQNNNGEPFSVTYITPDGGDFRQFTLGLEENSLDEVVVFPNPTVGRIGISNLGGEVTAAIYDTTGRIVRDNVQLNTNGVSSIDLFALKSGIYFLQLTDENNNASTMRRIIKK